MRPPILAQLQKGAHQIVLVAKVAVECRLSHSRLLDDEIDADRTYPLPAEQVVSSVEYPFSGSATRRRCASFRHSRHHTQSTLTCLAGLLEHLTLVQLT